MQGVQSWIPIGILFGYFIALEIYLLIAARLRKRTMGEYAVAGRTFPWWMVLFTVLGTWYTGAAFGAMTGAAVYRGFFMIYGATYSLVAIVIYYYMSPKVWIWGKVHNLYSMPDYVGFRYNSKSLATIFAIAGIVIGMPWQITGFRMFAYTMYELSYHALPLNIGVYIIPAIVLIYVLAGGMRGVVHADFVNGILSTVIVLGGIAYVVQVIFGGPGALLQQLVAAKPVEWLTIDNPGEFSAVVIACSLGSYCWLEMFNRIFVARSVKDLKMTARAIPIIVVLNGVLMVFLALGCALLPECTASPEAAESAFLTMASRAGGPILLGLFAVIVFTGETSSIDSQLNAYGVVLSKNIVGDNIKGGISERATIQISRIFILVWCIGASYIATLEIPMIFAILIFTYEFLVHLFPGIFFGMFWKRGSALATYCGLAVGIPITVVAMRSPAFGGLLGGYSAGLMGVIPNMIVYIVVSLLRKPTEHAEKIFREVDEYKAIES